MDLNKYAKEFARKGGNETYKKYGLNHYSIMGKKSAEKRNKKKLEALKKEVIIDNNKQL